MRFFTAEKIEKELRDVRAAMMRDTCEIHAFKFWRGPFDAAGPEGAERPDFDDREWADFRVGETWGGYDMTAWFRASIAIPREWAAREGCRAALRFTVGPRDGDSVAETLLYVDGAALQAIDEFHESAWLPPELLAADAIHVALKAWSGALGVPERRRFTEARLVLIDEATERLARITDTLLQAIRALGDTDLRRGVMLDALHGAYLDIDFSKPGSDAFYASAAGALARLNAALEAWRRAAGNGAVSVDAAKPKIVAIGHAHIDMAWLWRVAHTREKAARTFATALHLMRRYPAYRFMHSSPQLYKFLQADYPAIFNKVKAAIEAGQWEITGATWVEPDTNLTGGESLVRQFLFGTRWARREFGVEMRLLWLPDVFGYSAALPQIIAKSGIRYFLTSKISWSQFNRFPHDTFRWRGLDGTEVLTHFVTTPEVGSPWLTYNAKMRPAEWTGAWEQYRQRDVNDELLVLYGWGDGGGGPTAEMIETALDAQNLPGLPSVEPGHAEPYFERLAERVADKSLPVWDGELYLEYHRGTYTSQAQIKRANRRAEILYHNAEWLNAVADVLIGAQGYPLAELNAGWEMILLNQFHDILPGSSIHAVYEDAATDHERIAAIGAAALEGAQSAIAASLSHTADASAPGEHSLVVFNPLSWERDGLVEVPSNIADGLPDAVRAAGQLAQSDDGPRLLLPAANVPSLGFATSAPVESTREPLTVTPELLENRFYRLALNERGQIVSLFDKRRGREVLARGGRGNVFQAFEDKPMAFDAWDVDIYYGEKMAEADNLVEAAVEESGPLRGALRLVWRFRDSTITQRLTLYADCPRSDFRTEVDWHEAQVLLKVAFPVSVRSTRATYDIAFGSVERPTHWNTSWDWARFETPAHKWADLSEGDYGVALLNDCKYGYDIHNNVMRLTLIKSAVRPDPLADKGRHVFTYSLLPHEGDWRQGDVPREAYALNYPLLAATAPVAVPPRFSFAAVDAPNVIIETVKRAEDDADAWIVRLYEFAQSRRAVRLTFGRPVRRAVECNLMEQDEGPVDFDAHGLRFNIAPFEIKTFKVWFG